MNKLIQVNNLKKYFSTPKGLLHAVDDISFTIKAGETLGVVGESGCGKSTAGRSVVRLIEPTDGEVWYRGNNILDYNKAKLRQTRQDLQMIFQDPFSSLDPRRSVSQTIGEPLKIHGLISSKSERRDRVLEIMKEVGIDERFYNSYPHELDGGRRQRVGIARSLASNPEFIVCDEPVSALDVSIQAQILNLLGELQEKFELTYMFITHDLSVVNHFSDNIIVMYLGKIVEKAPADELFDNPSHPYTQALLSAIPTIDLDREKKPILLQGEISSPIEPEKNCRFSKRCPYVMPQCLENEPPMIRVGSDHEAACFLLKPEIDDMDLV